VSGTPRERADILAFGPHPDDVEIGAAATLALESSRGRAVVICDLTAGEMGTGGDAATREAEARQAARALGARERLCLGLPDTGLGTAPGQADLVAAVIRLYRPRLVLAPWGNDRHPDHRETYSLVRRALFLAALSKHRPPPVPGVAADPASGPPHRTELVFYYLINSPAEPEVMVDVSSCYEAKLRALAAFGSQFAERRRPDGADQDLSPVLDGAGLHGVQARDAAFGRHCGARFAEGFVAERYPCLRSLLDVISCR
jgi:bacillithiol biosynthesis deacetylase BshB1